EMIHFFKTKKLSQNTIKGIVEKIKSQLRKAGNYGYPVNSSYDEVFVKSADSTSVSLSMNEITRIYYYKDLTRKQKMIRDLFIVGCMTGLRYSDYSTLTIDNFQNKVIVKSTQKTGATVYIPMHPYVQEIYTRYRGQIPTGYTVSYFDRAIKQICQKIGINQSIPVVKIQGFETITTVKQKWELISSHTARRSFCSNALAAGDLSTSQIMMMSGHKSESCFFRYIKTDKIANAHRVSASKMFQI
ncbi:MAG: tyrosine-type recombinase/integrase, partial [Bacteroidales bacterium]